MRLVKNQLILLLATLILSGCLGTKYLKEDEKLLYKQSIKVEKYINKSDLDRLYSQEPNRRFPIIPFSTYVWFYYWGLKNYDIQKYQAKKAEIQEKFERKIIEADSNKTKIERLEKREKKKIAKMDKNIADGNFLMRIGEPIAIYDSAQTQATINRFDLYLDSKGYFNSKIENNISIRHNRVTSTYKIESGPPYKIDTLFLQAGDTAIAKLIQKNQSEKLINIGDNYEQSNLSKERERLDLLMKDNGYFDFSRQYIEFEVDTAYLQPQHVVVKTLINQPANRDHHKIFRVDSVNFISSTRDKGMEQSAIQSEVYKGITYRFQKNRYSEKVLNRRIFIKRDSLYSKTKTYNTQRQLANLDIFRFININYDSVGGQLVANIFTSPLSRYQWTNEVGVNVTQGFPGPFYNVTFKKRNIFRGLEIFEMSSRFGVEGVASVTGADDIYASIEAGVNAGLTFPQFILPISNSIKEQLGQVNPKTRLLAGYTYTRRPEYIRKNTNFTNTYSWQNQRTTFYQVTLTDISLIESEVSDTFQERLDSLSVSGNRLINAFKPSLVTSMNGSATWNFNSYGLNFTNSSFFRLYLESGGTSLNFVNTGFLDREKLEFYKFYKLNADYRKIHPVNKNTTVAYRLNAGFAKPYSNNGILPYEKYFFAGGSNGIRAWRPRRLGPGSYAPIDTVKNVIDYSFEQPGEIIFEGSLELRKNLVGFVDYAFFVDFGNTWTIKFDESRPGSQFKADSFFKEIAVGAGFGIRLDFSFLVLRVDAGLKVYDPARPELKRFILTKGFYDAPFTTGSSEAVVFNIGIGYPF